MLSKKLLALLATSALVVSALAGCGNTGKESSEVDKSVTSSESTESTVASETTQESEEAKEFTYPMEGDNSISCWAFLNGNVGANFAGLGETEWAKGINERTGITCEWVNSAMTDEDFNIMVASGEYTDLIEVNLLTYYPGGPEKAFEDGIAIPLNDIIDQYCPNLKAYLEANPVINKLIKTDDGTYFCFPAVSAKTQGFTSGAYLRADWLEELGLETPKSIDDWHTVLTAFKNEKGCEIPFTAVWNFLLKTSPFAYAYGVPGEQACRIVLDENGNCVFAPGTENYKAFLTTLHQWYDEGLIDGDIMSIANDSVKSKMVNGEAGASCSTLGGGLQAIMTAGMEIVPEFELVGAPAPEVDGTPAIDYHTTYQFNGNGTVMTSQCENIEAAARFMDWQYSEEGIIYNNFGTEGVSYNVVDGKYVFTDEVLNNPNGWSLGQSVAKYARAGAGNLVAHNDYYPQTLVLDAAKEANVTWSNSVEDPYARKVPPVTLTSEESDIVAKKSTELLTYVDEMSVKFVLGTLSFDEWDTYIATIEQMGASELVEAYEAAVTRYNAR